MNGKPWSSEEWQKASELLALGHDRKFIAAAIGRPTDDLRKKIHYEQMTPAEYMARRMRTNARRQAAAQQRPPRPRKQPATIVLVSEKAPPALFEERARRQAIEYRDLTGEFFGDPKPGYSALDRREQRA